MLIPHTNMQIKCILHECPKFYIIIHNAQNSVNRRHFMCTSSYLLFSVRMISLCTFIGTPRDGSLFWGISPCTHAWRICVGTYICKPLMACTNFLGMQASNFLYRYYLTSCRYVCIVANTCAGILHRYVMAVHCKVCHNNNGLHLQYYSIGSTV